MNQYVVISGSITYEHAGDRARAFEGDIVYLSDEDASALAAAVMPKAKHDRDQAEAKAEAERLEKKALEATALMVEVKPKGRARFGAKE